MALEIVAGALAGTALNELLGAIKDARRKISSFERILTRLESTLAAISPRLHEITLLSNKLHHHHSKHHQHQPGIADLVILARDGKDLVRKCSKLSSINLVKKAQYSKMLHDLDCSLLRYFDTVLQLDQSKDNKETLLLVKEMRKYFPLDNDNDNDDKSRLIYDEITRLSRLGAENDELDEFTKEEDRAEYSSSSLERDNLQVNDDILKRVPEVRKEDRAEDSASSLVRDNQVYDDILKWVPKVRKEDRTEYSSSSLVRRGNQVYDDILKRVPPEVRKEDLAEDSSSSLDDEIRSLTNLGGGVEESENDELYEFILTEVRKESKYNNPFKVEDRGEYYFGSIAMNNHQADDILKRVPEVRKESKNNNPFFSFIEMNYEANDTFKRIWEVCKESENNGPFLSSIAMNNQQADDDTFNRISEVCKESDNNDPFFSFIAMNYEANDTFKRIWEVCKESENNNLFLAPLQ